MDVLAAMQAGGHEQVIFHQDPASGLRVIAAIHSRVLGPAMGGARWRAYASEAEALTDVLRLSRAMTYKSAVAGLRIGGGKAVILGDPAAKTTAQLHAYGRFVDSLGGRYITTTDVGTFTRDLDVIRDVTRYVVGTSPERGGSGDTSLLTSVTVIHGMRAALQAAFGEETFAGRRIVVVGTGKVGSRVARHAAAQGAEVRVADVRAEAVQSLAAEIGAGVVEVADAYTMECDVLSPNALGGVLNERSIPRLRCRVICGGANNQLERDPDDADLLRARGILYAPDYVVNAGGIINAGVEWEGYDAARAERLAAAVYQTTREVLRSAEAQGISTAAAAAQRVEQILSAAQAG